MESPKYLGGFYGFLTFPESDMNKCLRTDLFIFEGCETSIAASVGSISVHRNKSYRLPGVTQN